MQDVSYHNGATPQVKREPFAIVPQRVIFDERLSERAKIVLMAIASYANRDRVCVVKQGTIAKRLDLRREAVNRATAMLATFNYLEITHLGAEGRRGRAANGYRLLFDVYGNPIPPDDGTRINVLPTTHKSDPTPINVLAAAHYTDDLCAADDTQIVMCSPAHSNTPDLCAPQRTALTGSNTEGRTGSVSGDLISSLTGVEEQKEQDRFAHARDEESSPLDVDEATPQIRKHPVLWRELATKLEPDDFKRSNWLGRCELVECDGAFIVGTPTTFARDHVTQKYGDALAANLRILARTRGIAFQSLDIAAPPAKPKHSETPPASYSHAM